MDGTSTSRSTALRVDRPKRGADRNSTLAKEDSAPSANRILFPDLDDGITLLDIEGGRGVTALQAFALDHLLMTDGPAFWVDAHGYATTTTLGRLAPSQRLLDRIHVARGFTAYQHFGVVADLAGAINEHVRQAAREESLTSRRTRRQERPGRDPESSPLTPSLIVAPAVDALYRADDTLGTDQAQKLLTRALARLRRIADSYDVPVLLTRTNTDEFTAPTEAIADHTLTCEQTSMGPRFVGDDFETLVYPVDDGAYYQTTFAYWREILATRAEQVGLQPAGPGTPAESEAASGPTSPRSTPNPLLDAWSG